MPERQCVGCTNKVEWGCNALKWKEPDNDTVIEADECWVSPAYMPLTVDGEDTYACPRQTLHRYPGEWHRLLMFHSMYRAGHLPQKGAVLDQANVMIEAFAILDGANAEIDAELNKRAAAREANKQDGHQRV